MDIQYPTLGQIFDIIWDCAIGASVVALGTAVATDGAAVPAAQAAFLAAFKLCLKVKLGELVEKDVKVNIGWDSKTGDWSGH